MRLLIPVAFVLSAGLFTAVAPVASVSEGPTYDASNGISRSGVVADDDYEAYKIVLQPWWSASARAWSSNGAAFDLYLLTSSGFTEYWSPWSQSFSYEQRREKTLSADVSVGRDSGQRTFYVVVDNAAVSQSGATPNGDLPYAIEITVLQESGIVLPRLESFLYGGVAAAVLAGGYAGYAARDRRKPSKIPGICPSCHGLTSHVSQYDRYWCAGCKQYV
jgi:hypothetical protein